MGDWHLQCRKHVSWRDNINTNASMSPLNSQTGGQMSDSCLCCVVWCLRLGNVDNSARHAANKDHGSGCLSLHQVLSNCNCKEVCAIHVDAPKLADSLDRVVDSFEVLSESSGSDQVVDFAMVLDNLSDGGLDGLLGGNVGIVCSDLGDPEN